MRKLLLISSLLLWGPSLYAQSVRYQSQVIGSRGTPLANQNVAVCSQPANTSTTPCSPLATLATSTSTTSGGANPLTTDINGNFFFYAAPGRYTIQIYGPQISTAFVQPDVEISCGPAAGCASQTFTFNAGGVQAWFKLGTWVASAQGDDLKIDFGGGSTFGSGNSSAGRTEITLRSGNATFAPNLAGVLWTERVGSSISGQNTPAIVNVKAAATGGSTSVSNNSWDVFVLLNAFSAGPWTFSYEQGDIFTFAGTAASDPGSASSTVAVGIGGWFIPATTPLTLFAGPIAGGTISLTGTGACSTGSLTGATGGAWNGGVTCGGTTGASTLVITPGTPAPHFWNCWGSDTTAGHLLTGTQSGVNATTCTLSFTSVTTSDVVTITAAAF